MSIEVQTTYPTITPSDTWQRAAVMQHRAIPDVRLAAFDHEVGATGFRIFAIDVPIGFLWITNFDADSARVPEVNFSVIGSKQDLWAAADDPIFEQYAHKGYGLAAYLLAIEHFAEQGRTLRSSDMLSKHSLSLWKRLVRYGIAACQEKPVLRYNFDCRQPDYYKARYCATLTQDVIE